MKAMTDKDEQTPKSGQALKAPRLRGMTSGEVITYVILTVTAIYVWIESANFDSVGALWPRALAAALLASLILDRILYFLKAGRKSASVDSVDAEPTEAGKQPEAEDMDSVDALVAEALEENEPKLNTGLSFLYFAVIVAFGVTAFLFGFLTVVPIFIAGFMIAKGFKRRPLMVATVSIVFTAVVYYLFDVLANTPLTKGLLLSYELPQLF